MSSESPTFCPVRRNDCGKTQPPADCLNVLLQLFQSVPPDPSTLDTIIEGINNSFITETTKQTGEPSALFRCPVSNCKTASVVRLPNND